MKRVLIANRRQVEGCAYGNVPLISISERSDPPLKITGTDILFCHFPDSYDPLELPDFEITKILNFLHRHKDAEVIHVQCAAGLSRSAAVALFCAEQYGAEVDMRGKFPNLEVVRKLRDLSGLGDWF